MMSTTSICLFLCLVCILPQIEGNTASTDPITGPTCTIRFYLMSLNMWTQNFTSTIKSYVSAGVDAYCELHYASCGLRFANESVFNSSGVDFVDGPNNYGSNYLQIAFNVQSVLGTTVPGAIVGNIVLLQRQVIEAIIGRYIVHINGVQYSPPPPTQLNIIIISVASSIVLILLIFTFIIQQITFRKTIAAKLETAALADNSSSVFGGKHSAPNSPKENGRLTSGGSIKAGHTNGFTNQAYTSDNIMTVQAIDNEKHVRFPSTSPESDQTVSKRPRHCSTSLTSLNSTVSAELAKMDLPSKPTEPVL